MLQFLVIVLFIGNIYCYKQYDPFENPMCNDNVSSCENLFGNIYRNVCQKISYKVNNQTICDSKYNEDDTIINNANLGDLVLYPICEDSNRRTIFNVTFVNIRFQKLRIRFQEYINNSKVLDKCMVKEFIFKSNLLPDYSFSYVCPWSDSSFEGHTVELDYDYGIEKYDTRKKYKFMVPESSLLREDNENVYFFAFVDYSDLSNLILHINSIQNKYNITKYNIQFIRIYENKTSVLSEDNFTFTDSSHNFKTYSDPGYYYFRIVPISSYCSKNKNACLAVETAKVLIVPESISLIGIVGGSLILIPIFAIIIYIWTKKWIGLPRPKPKVLLVSVPINNAHAIVSPHFAKFLQETYNIDVMLDTKDILTNNCSFSWLKTCLEKTTHIIYLRSKDDLNSNLVIYTDTYSQIIHLLDPKFIEKRKKECIVTFSYSDKISNFSHPELSHIKKRFNFEDLHKLIKFLINKNVTIEKNTPTYQNLLTAICDVTNEEPAVKNLPKNNICIPIGDEISEKYSESVESDSENKSLVLEEKIEKKFYGEIDSQSIKSDEKNYDCDLDYEDFL